jgi:hypothetical protein
MSRVVLGAVSDDQDFHTSRQPTILRPIRMALKGPERLPIKPSISLERPHKAPPIVPYALQERFGGIPGIEEDVFGATAQAVRA